MPASASGACQRLLGALGFGGSVSGSHFGHEAVVVIGRLKVLIASQVAAPRSPGIDLPTYGPRSPASTSRRRSLTAWEWFISVNTEIFAGIMQYSQRFLARSRTRRSSDGVMAYGSWPAFLRARMAWALKMERI